MKGNIKKIIMVVVAVLVALSDLSIMDIFCNNMNVYDCEFSEVEIMYSDFDTDTPFSISPEMFDKWYDDTSIIKITIKDVCTIAFIDSIINNAEPMYASTIDTRCRILFTRNKKRECIVDSFYLSSTIIYHKNNGKTFKNNESTQEFIHNIVSHEMNRN